MIAALCLDFSEHSLCSTFCHIEDVPQGFPTGSASTPQISINHFPGMMTVLTINAEEDPCKGKRCCSPTNQRWKPFIEEKAKRNPKGMFEKSGGQSSTAGDRCPTLPLDLLSLDGGSQHKKRESSANVFELRRIPSKDLPPILSPRLSTRRGRTVRFCSKPNVHHGEATTLTRDEIKASWYSRQDYNDFQHDMNDTLEAIASGLLHPERSVHCFRGLEFKTPEVALRRKENIRNGLQAVFSVQDRFERLRSRNQRLLDLMMESDCESDDEDDSSVSSDFSAEEACEILGKNNEWELIASSYGECSFHCQLEAQRIGVWDAKIAINLWKQDEVPRAPRRTRAACA